MAERSFKKEVQKLKMPANEPFSGEGILAITKALLESGVGYVGGYPGAPISHLMDVLSDAEDILTELGVHFEACASEASATAMLAASINYPIRGAVTFKGPVGVNVASDALANLSSAGVTGGALIIVGDDYGEGSSIMQERSHAFAMKSQVWQLDPRPNHPSMVQAVKQGFELSEASNTPVMMQLRIRACHVHGQFITSENLAPPLSAADALANPQRQPDRIVLPPYSYIQEQEKVKLRKPAAEAYIKENQLNEFFGPDDAPQKVGLVLQGGLYNTVIRALQLLGLADDAGNSQIPLYVLNVTYPLLGDEFLQFCQGKHHVLLLEEGQPNHMEQEFSSILHQQDAIRSRLHGKDYLPMAGEYTTATVLKGISAFLQAHASTEVAEDLAYDAAAQVDSAMANSQSILPLLPPRPPGFCVGCPERPVFAAMKMVERDAGGLHVAGDIGCHLFSSMAPFDLGQQTMGFGLGPASNGAFGTTQSGDHQNRAVAVMGDGGFWHNGLTSGIAGLAYNKSDSVVMLVDNYYTAATGGQDVPSSRVKSNKGTQNSIAKALKGVGVKWLRQHPRTYAVGDIRDSLKEAISTPTEGPKVILASSECMLNRQRREKPQLKQAIQAGERVVSTQFGIDDEVCTGDHACIRLSGCPSLTIKDSPNPFKADPIAHIDDACVGCGNCGEVAHADALCPSFYEIERIHNPTAWERWKNKFASSVISWLQQRRERTNIQLTNVTEEIN
jgi:indolepyruvate ferredoxin oxidoreductase alpha subunit